MSKNTGVNFEPDAPARRMIFQNALVTSKDSGSNLQRGRRDAADKLIG